VGLNSVPRWYKVDDGNVTESGEAELMAHRHVWHMAFYEQREEAWAAETGPEAAGAARPPRCELEVNSTPPFLQLPEPAAPICEHQSVVRTISM
jgi:hypothetical protein